MKEPINKNIICSQCKGDRLESLEPIGIWCFNCHEYVIISVRENE